MQTHSATDLHTKQPSCSAPAGALFGGEALSLAANAAAHAFLGFFELLLTNKSVHMKNKPLKNPSLFTPGSLVFLQTVRLSRLFTGNGSIGRTFCCADEILKSCFLLRSKSLFPLHGFTELLFTCFPLNRKIPSLFHFYGKTVWGILALMLQDTSQELSAWAAEKSFPKGQNSQLSPKSPSWLRWEPRCSAGWTSGAQHGILCGPPKGLLIQGNLLIKRSSHTNLADFHISLSVHKYSKRKSCNLLCQGPVAAFAARPVNSSTCGARTSCFG